MKPAVRRSWIAVLVVLSNVSLRAHDDVQPWRLSDLVSIADVVLAAALAGAALYFARQQVRIHRQRVASEQRDRRLQRRHDLFDRRWRVFQGVYDYFNRVTNTDDPELVRTAVDDFWRTTREAPFLFASDVNDYLEELRRRGNRLYKWTLKRHQMERGQPDREAKEGWLTEQGWFSDQFAEAQPKFECYLRLSDEERPESIGHEAS